FPLGEPVDVAPPDLLPRGEVGADKRSQQHTAPEQSAHDACRIASIDAGSSSDERSPGSTPSAVARIARRSTFALRVFGSDATNRMPAGLNALPNECTTTAISSSRRSSDGCAPGARTTYAHSSSPLVSFGIPT